MFYATPPVRHCLHPSAVAVSPPIGCHCLLRRRRFSSRHQTAAFLLDRRRPLDPYSFANDAKQSTNDTMERPRKSVNHRGICLKKLLHDISLHFE
nr:hypothetical protein Iba_chr12fCG22350 [Ipomoea batatas]